MFRQQMSISNLDFLTIINRAENIRIVTLARPVTLSNERILVD